MKGKAVKLLVSSLVSILFVVLFLCSTAFAEDMKTSEDLDKTNQFVEDQIDKAVKDAEKAINEYEKKVSEVNKKIAKEEEKSEELQLKMQKHKEEFQNKIEQIAQELIKKTEEKVTDLIEKFAKKDIRITSDYVEVKLGDTVYLVDPLRFY